MDHDMDEFVESPITLFALTLNLKAAAKFNEPSIFYVEITNTTNLLLFKPWQL